LKRLPKSFYARDALDVARDLIGCLFVKVTRRGPIGVRLVETEAYRGSVDPGSHGYRGMTPRTTVMFGPPGRLYVYFTYGMHWCANVVTGDDGVCQAVLLRAGRPELGVETMFRNRPGIVSDRLLAAGPARLTKAMGIDKRQNGASLLRGGDFYCTVDEVTEEFQAGKIAQTVRVGISEGHGEDIPWRFVVPGDPYASRRR
jgi:DNA-3-methyladenine glycosylase